jgi:pilus assembly protein Flp/PilA
MTTLQTLCANAGCMIRRFGNDQSGATAIEYAMIAIGISVVIVAAVTSIGASVKGAFTSASNGFN